MFFFPVALFEARGNFPILNCHGQFSAFTGTFLQNCHGHQNLPLFIFFGGKILCPFLPVANLTCDLPRAIFWISRALFSKLPRASKSATGKKKTLFSISTRSVSDQFFINIWSVFWSVLGDALTFLTSIWPVFDQYLISIWPVLISIWSIFNEYLFNIWWIFDQYLTSIWPVFDHFPWHFATKSAKSATLVQRHF